MNKKQNNSKNNILTNYVFPFGVKTKLMDSDDNFTEIHQ